MHSFLNKLQLNLYKSCVIDKIESLFDSCSTLSIIIIIWYEEKNYNLDESNIIHNESAWLPRHLTIHFHLVYPTKSKLCDDFFLPRVFLTHCFRGSKYS